MSTSPDPALITVGEAVTLNASCTRGEEPLGFAWELGDGRSRSGRVIHPRYHEQGTYRVRLHITDGRGRQDSTEVEVRVDVPPRACVEWSRAPGNDLELAPCGFRFDATCSTGDLVEYRWFFQGNPDWPDFEDVTMTTTEPTVGFTWREDIVCRFFRPFERIVRLTVVDANGRTSTVEELVQVTRPLRAP